MPLTGICFLSQERAEKKSEEVLEVEPLPGVGESYVLQKVRCGMKNCHCTRPGRKLHGPHLYLFTKDGGKMKVASQPAYC